MDIILKINGGVDDMPSGCILDWCPYCREAVWEDQYWKLTPSRRLAHQGCHQLPVRVQGEVISDESDGTVRTIRILEDRP